MRRNYNANRLLCAVYAVFGLFCSVSRPSKAQTIYTPQMTTALHTTIHLQMGKTTLDAAMQALSQQTGQSIECADYLKEHRLTLHIESATAEDVLNQLADLTHCKWTEAGAKRVLFSRVRPVLPEHPLQIPAALQTVLPPDVQRYIGIALPEGLWLTQEQKAANVKDTRWWVSEQIQKHSAAMREDIEANIWTNTANALTPGSKYTYISWTLAQRQAVALTLFANSIEILNNSGMVATMNEQYDAYMRDPALTEIRFKRDPMNKDKVNRSLDADMLWLGAHTESNGFYRYQGFGVGISLFTTPLPEKPIPLENIK